ncbi:MAG: CMP/dCMP deaminase zinc-binding protein [candidate division WWE3 bacterium GW2011_GWB1_47_11]|uniref:CMP/dCMP deaminase zinc-binding protein n=1 Tax=candidate division WWE3 bacterium GW2011_GWB1_47_11 TaxID=1619117 RepID=A0A0G1UH69_UNCKA|nr:MAG: CMP/dCMP deaminase zinc-binding protein [candidate division WWE3 bacterium GW2011_GWB1_47_11]
MELTILQMQKLKELMINSARKGNLANSGLVIENENTIATAESWVVTNHDATAHSERMLVENVCKAKGANYTPGLTMVTVCEPCLMCMSACAWAGYKTIVYLIPANKYINKIPWMSDNTKVNKQEIAATFNSPIELVHLSRYEEEFSKIFEWEMKGLLN